MVADEKRGLYNKYTVICNETGEPIDGECFVLRPDRDPAAVAALRAYAAVTENRKFGKEIHRWLDTIVKGGKENG